MYYRRTLTIICYSTMTYRSFSIPATFIFSLPRNVLILILFASGIYFHCNGQSKPRASGSQVKEVIACGDDKVVIFDRRSSHGNDLKHVWQWSPSDGEGLPLDYRKYFSTTDECKPVEGNRLLVTSSRGGVVLVDRETKATLFYAHVPNAHSADYLPGDRIIVALSTAPKGNSIQLFDVDKPDQILFQDSLYSGHGAVWIPERKLLFVLGYDVLRTYSLKDWDTDQPALSKEAEWKLPDNGGHDLYSVSPDELLLSTSGSVWRFNVHTSTFSPFAPLENVANVKSVNYDANTGELVYTKGEISWWTHNIYFQHPADTLRVPEIDLYKVRVIWE